MFVLKPKNDAAPHASDGSASDGSASDGSASDGSASDGSAPDGIDEYSNFVANILITNNDSAMRNATMSVINPRNLDDPRWTNTSDYGEHEINKLINQKYDSIMLERIASAFALSSIPHVIDQHTQLRQLVVSTRRKTLPKLINMTDKELKLKLLSKEIANEVKLILSGNSVGATPYKNTDQM
jgi:hypothetical protein